MPPLIRPYAPRAPRAAYACALIGTLALAASGQSAVAAEPASAPTATASGLLQPFQAGYNWYWRGMRVAVSTIILKHQTDDLWMYSSVASPRGIGMLYPERPSLLSVVRITNDGVLPQTYRVTGGGANHDADVMYDWVSGRAIGNNEGARVDLPIKPGVQDDMSVQLAMMVQLLAGKMPTLALDLDKGNVREYDYSRAGEEQLNTALGPINTVIYAAHHPGSPRVTRFWCAPTLGYIPMQVQQMRINDVEWTMQIQSLKRS